MDRRSYFIVFIMLLYAAGIFAEEISDTRGYWSIGVAEFGGDKLSRENGYLLSSLPMQLLDIVKNVRFHTLSDVERGIRETYILTEKINTGLTEIARLYKNYDLLRLSNAPGSAAVVNILKKIETADEELRRLREYDPGDIPVASSKPVKIIEGKNETLLPVVRTDAKRVSESFELDLLIFGIIEQVSDYLFIDVVLYNAAEDSRETLSTAGSRETIRDRMAELGDTIISRVFGEEWGTLEIASQIDESRYWIDGEYIGSGARELKPVNVGTHIVRIETPGYESAEYRVDVRSGERTVFTRTSVTERERSVRIDTEPSGASVYIGSILQGLTPITVAPPLEPSQLQAELPGYGAHQRVISPDESGELNITLIPESIDDIEIVQSRRRVFYRSLGWFALSVPIPLYLVDITNQLTGVINAAYGSSIQVPSQLVEQRQMAFAGSIGGMILAGALLMNALIDLFDYMAVVGLRSG